MSVRDINFEPELVFTASRSSGKGGQHVNKVSTKIELSFDVQSSGLLDPEQKELLFQKISSRINKEGVLKIVVQESRSQAENKRLAIEKFYGLLERSFRKEKPRVATRQSKAAQEKRLQKKKIHSEKKKLRSKRFDH